ncbi:hypothetical protein KQI49_09165 [Virgibacillus sp. MSJ-26]|uniref:hypothetical protein n=1 Tax=Virgibacillus sp. MSJ-26 TaxID=2841522 RepID=UPI001C1276E2|nr:hypothetical protein [Virgibacillus sp. MSJ-26]MBU5466990.1 hypothetical protein [Virgibacillus sp. MSJ-26]
MANKKEYIDLDKLIERTEPLLHASYRYHLERLKYNSNEQYIDSSLIETAEYNVKEIRSLLGGVPELLILGRDEDKPFYDTYVDSMINELIFSIKKSYDTMVQVMLYRRIEYFSRYYEDQKLADLLVDTYKKEFWSHLEMAYIRLASTWDRIGRLLDFVYFNIRQYDKDGYLSTIQKINVNLIPMSVQLRESNAWKKVWDYSKSESVNGLKWLLSRRNLIVHQISLQEIEYFDVEDTEFYNSEHNHILENTVKKKLKPMSPNEEVTHLKKHIEITLELFEDIKELCNLGTELIPKLNNSTR